MWVDSLWSDVLPVYSESSNGGEWEVSLSCFLNIMY